MVTGLLLIIGSYGLSVALIHLFHAMHVHNEDRKIVYLLIVGNHQNQVEWYIRSISFYSWLKGKVLQMYVVDEGSTDETIHIVEQFTRRNESAVTVLPASQIEDQILSKHGEDHVVVIHLAKLGETRSLSLYR